MSLSHVLAPLFAVIAVVPPTPPAPATAPSSAPTPTRLFLCPGTVEQLSPCTASGSTTTNNQFQEVYGLSNNSIEDDDVSIELSGLSSSIATCTSNVPDVTVRSHGAANFIVTCTGGAGGGSGNLTVTTLGIAELTSTLTVTVTAPSTISVTPQTTLNTTALPNTAYKQIYTITNLSSTAVSDSTFVTCDAGETSCSVKPRVLSLGGNASGTDTLFYSSVGSGTSGTATHTAKVTGQPNSVATSTISVAVPAAMAPSVGSYPQNGDIRSPGMCAVSCLDKVAAFSTPAYTSYDTPRSVTLFYSSAQAAPMGEVQLQVANASARPPNRDVAPAAAPQC